MQRMQYLDMKQICKSTFTTLAHMYEHIATCT